MMRTVRFRRWETLQYNHLVPRSVGRFQVMATLQAARAKILGLPLASAKSWGLNRAIYYAAAKRGFKSGSGPAKPEKHQHVYRPRRDELAAKWNERAQQ